MTHAQQMPPTPSPRGHPPAQASDRDLYGRLIVCRGRAGISHDDYIRHYREVHYPLAIRMPKLLHYVQLPVEFVEGGLSSWDSVSLYVYETENDYLKAMQSEAAIPLEKDSVYLM
ncbi:uncharacterized protein I303_103215 [Kwoniella dejecticola CBS 10117]|uniref:EthD domain-containing protein n=1 Tax=Kwoniella dejecticola CBS 10117 TaxID=1296121 RepID=A0A1A6AAY9_9TREE|nr:uncharacterized protein I303_03239 [Kwoniella dejecticola CBS 10117]OBR87215.1 hypothetical protein I303_03239 [Kwoniella dejecticola CBS 10117]